MGSGVGPPALQRCFALRLASKEPFAQIVEHRLRSARTICRALCTSTLSPWTILNSCRPPSTWRTRKSSRGLSWMTAFRLALGPIIPRPDRLFAATRRLAIYPEPTRFWHPPNTPLDSEILAGGSWPRHETKYAYEGNITLLKNSRRCRRQSQR